MNLSVSIFQTTSTTTVYMQDDSIAARNKCEIVLAAFQTRYGSKLKDKWGSADKEEYENARQKYKTYLAKHRRKAVANKIRRVQQNLAEEIMVENPLEEQEAVREDGRGDYNCKLYSSRKSEVDDEEASNVLEILRAGREHHMATIQETFMSQNKISIG